MDRSAGMAGTKPVLIAVVVRRWSTPVRPSPWAIRCLRELQGAPAAALWERRRWVESSDAENRAQTD